MNTITAGDYQLLRLKAHSNRKNTFQGLARQKNKFCTNHNRNQTCFLFLFLLPNQLTILIRVIKHLLQV